jgi:DNA repair protein RecN (Recombination protein N)
MLTTLRIKNLALVEDLTVELLPGYNVITGETGAGKSILIGALNLVLGERAERTLIRSGSDSCTVEAVFDVRKLKTPLASVLEENGLEPCEDYQLVVKRTFTASGTNRQFINGSATSLSVLYKVGEWLVDIHGPHEHQSLLQPGRQLDMVDAFGSLEKERDALNALFRRRTALENEKAGLIGDDATYAQQLDLFRFQLKEITAAKLAAGEEAEVEAEYRRAGNAAKLMQLSRAALDLLSENETSVLSQAGIIGRTLQELRRIDPTAEGIVTLHEQAVSALRDLQAEISKYEGKVDVDPQRLQELEERLSLIQSLKRKYGGTVADVIAFGEGAAEKLKKLEGREAELERIKKQLEKLDGEIERVAKVLSEKRRKVCPQLGKAVRKQLADLGFKQSRFEMELRSLESENSGPKSASFPPLKEGGKIAKTKSEEAKRTEESAALRRRLQDEVEFQFSPNQGEPLRPLRAIASSGELARVMLAIKTVLAAEDQVPVLVFDEVDANVGGETAVAVGEKMQQIARSRQVLCITHLPQVAAPAGAHFMALKEVKAGRTISKITRLEKDERVTELARMLGGQTEAARRHAEELLMSKDE